MANYNLLVPSVRTFLTHIGALPTAAGFVIGCCDLASMCACQLDATSCELSLWWICITWPVPCLPKTQHSVRFRFKFFCDVVACALLSVCEAV